MLQAKQMTKFTLDAGEWRGSCSHKRANWHHDGAGALWFTEYNAGKVGRITTDGAITEFPLTAAGSGAWGITTGADQRHFATAIGQ